MFDDGFEFEYFGRFMGFDVYVSNNTLSDDDDNDDDVSNTTDDEAKKRGIRAAIATITKYRSIFSMIDWYDGSEGSSPVFDRAIEGFIEWLGHTNAGFVNGKYDHLSVNDLDAIDKVFLSLNDVVASMPAQDVDEICDIIAELHRVSRKVEIIIGG